jgi:hypothetical protein
MLIRFWAAIDLVDTLRAGAGLVRDFLRFAFCDGAFAAIGFLKKMVGSGALSLPDPDALPVEVCPRSATTMSWVRP